ncbi:hypothetical protein ALQ60_200344 [Pseudomonas syringae pv. papulans]|nr:hypothetical protein ALQ60_200344 [Pseudomonas syringae pv. papulans]
MGIAQGEQHDVPVAFGHAFLDLDVANAQALQDAFQTGSAAGVHGVDKGVLDPQPEQAFRFGGKPRDVALPSPQLQNRQVAGVRVELQVRPAQPFGGLFPPKLGGGHQLGQLQPFEPERQLELDHCRTTARVLMRGMSKAETMSLLANRNELISGNWTCSSSVRRLKLKRDWGNVRVGA